MKPRITHYPHYGFYSYSYRGARTYGWTARQAYTNWVRTAVFNECDATGKPIDRNGDVVKLREPTPVQSETATNALHQHQPAPAPKGWKTKVSEVLKRLVHNHPTA